MPNEDQYKLTEDEKRLQNLIRQIPYEKTLNAKDFQAELKRLQEEARAADAVKQKAEHAAYMEKVTAERDKAISEPFPNEAEVKKVLCNLSAGEKVRVNKATGSLVQFHESSPANEYDGIKPINSYDAARDIISGLATTPVAALWVRPDVMSIDFTNAFQDAHCDPKSEFVRAAEQASTQAVLQVSEASKAKLCNLSPSEKRKLDNAIDSVIAVENTYIRQDSDGTEMPARSPYQVAADIIGGLGHDGLKGLSGREGVATHKMTEEFQLALCPQMPSDKPKGRGQ